MAIETKRPFGTSPTRSAASPTVCPAPNQLEQVVEEQDDLQVDDDRERHPDHQVDLALQRGQDPPEGPRPGRDPVRQAGAADGGHDEAAPAVHHEAPGVDGVAGPLGHQVRLAGQLRLVGLQRSVDQPTIEDHLVAGADAQQVAHHQVLGRHRPLRALAHEGRRGSRQQRDPVEGPLGTHLLGHAHDDVRADDADRDEGVQRAADDDQEHAQHEDHVVDEREDVLAQDLQVGAAGGGGRGVPVPGRAAARGLGVGQAGRGRRRKVRAGAAGRRRRGR